MPRPSTSVQSVERVEPDVSPVGTPQPEQRGDRPSLALLGLICVLTIQAVMSLRLIWSNTAFLDEGTYLYVGHVELAHWLSGTNMPPYPAWLSGAPVIYPPLGAIVNNLGGLAAARIASMCFMLGATSLLWGMTSRLADRWSALFAAAIFAALGPTQALGALATYDAMALFLMAAAAWCVVAARDHPDSSLLLLAGAALLALANATKYMTVLFDPVIIALAALTAGAKHGMKPGWGRGGFIAVSSIGVLAGLLGLGGSLYVHAVLFSTLTRAKGVSSPLVIMTDAAKLIGVCCLLAALAVVVAALVDKDRFQLAIFGVLAAAGLLVPLNQARIDTLTSLFKHVDFGAWFAAAAVGYAIARLSHVGTWKPLRVITATLALGAVILPIGSIGRTQARNFFQAWPNSSAVTKILGPLTRSHPGNYLAEDYYVPAYYLEDSVPWQRWTDTWYFSYMPPHTTRTLTGVAAYRAAIRNHYFSLIILDFGDTASVDKQLAPDIRKANYHVIAEAPYWDRFGSGQYTIWAYQRPRPLHGSHLGQH